MLSALAACSPQPSLQQPANKAQSPTVEAAGQVVQLFGAYLEFGELSKAAEQWSDPAAGMAFARQLKGTTHLEIGELAPVEGAAGSIYTTMAVTFYGEGFRRPAVITLRRVNDVPGSTERQRQWHIERIEWKPAP
jgi:hypothetical protein